MTIMQILVNIVIVGTLGIIIGGIAGSFLGQIQTIIGSIIGFATGVIIGILVLIVMKLGYIYDLLNETKKKTN